jgi:hypothetical protein
MPDNTLSQTGTRTTRAIALAIEKAADPSLRFAPVGMTRWLCGGIPCPGTVAWGTRFCSKRFYLK